VTEPTSIDFLTVDDLLDLSRITLGNYSLRDPGLLASAAARPQATVFGSDAYETLAAKALALMHSLVCNHAFIDGNKRMGWVAMRSFLILNGRDVKIDQDDAYGMVIAIAVGDLDVPNITDLISENIFVLP